jgi:hypothetical protein
MNLALATERLPRSLQRLIDARLDTIDRMLLGRLPRADRLAVTREVESQIYELLGERLGNELDREDVLVVLAKLDPPEAYIPEEGGFEATAVLLPARATRPAPRTGESRTAMVLGILGLGILALVLLWPLTFVAIHLSGVGQIGLLLLGAESALMMLAGAPVFVLSLLWRHSGGWAILGMVSGIIGFLAGLLTSVVCLIA